VSGLGGTAAAGATPPLAHSTERHMTSTPAPWLVQDFAFGDVDGCNLKEVVLDREWTVLRQEVGCL
jgi:hypothetical protein